MELALYRKNYHIDLSDVDFKKKLKLSSLFEYFQDVASLAADALGVGIEVLQKEHGVAWVLNRMRVDIERMPDWDEEITIETWPLEPGRLEFNRDYIVKDRAGNIIIRAISSWIIMDLVKRRLKRVSSLPFHFSTLNEERAIEAPFHKWKDLEKLETVYTKQIGYSDIDINGHLNNSRYIDYIMDCFPMEEHRQNDITSIEVNFTKEALPGDILLMKKDLSELGNGHIYVEGIHRDNGHTIFKAKIEIEKQEGQQG